MAWRTSLFSGIYMLGVISGSVYREKFGIFEHVLAGGLTAAIYRSHLGLRGMWFGTILGELITVCCWRISFTIKGPSRIMQLLQFLV